MTGGAFIKRWPVWAASTTAVLFVAAQAVVPTPPKLGATGEQVVKYYQDHANGVRLSVWIAAVSLIPFVSLLAWARRRLRGMSRVVMFLGAIAVLVETTLLSWMNGGLAVHASTLDPHVARTVLDIGAFYGPVLTVSVIVLALPIGLAAWKGTGGFAKWLAWVTAVLVVEQVIETVTIFGKSGFTAPGGAMNNVLGAGLFLVWFICVGAAATPEAAS
jgi:hypothetical protein